MNSLELYREIFSKNKYKSLATADKLASANEVVKTIFQELNRPPFKLKGSPFISEEVKIIDFLRFNQKNFSASWRGRNIALIDAYFFTMIICELFRNENYDFCNDAAIYSQAEFFFAELPYNNNEKKIIESIENDLKTLGDELKKRQVEYNAKLAESMQNPFQAESQSPLAGEAQSFNSSNVANSYSSKNFYQTQMNTPPVQIPTRPTIKSQSVAEPPPAQATLRQTQPPASSVQVPPKSAIMQEYAAKTQAQIELQKHLAAKAAERTKQLELRSKDNAQKISEWYGKQANLAQSVKALQMPAQKLLEDLRNFSNNLTNNYIVQFAACQIELFNLISENLNWHRSRAENSLNKDYCDAVENYTIYLDMIIDALANFGVDEISSAAGTHFDGKIHDVKNTKNFFPQTAKIKKSLRSGFRYNDLILQKEAVEV